VSDTPKYPRRIAHVSAKAGDPGAPPRRMTFDEAIAVCEREQERMLDELEAQIAAHCELAQGATVH
jgi:hypothetical protein